MCFEAHKAGDQVTPFFHVFVVILFLANVVVVVAGYAAAGYAGIVELEIQFLSAVAASRSRNPYDDVNAAFPIS
jgi:hypothetical protein